MKITAVKTPAGYVASMDDSGIPVGAEVMLEYTKNRNPGNHRRYFAAIKQMFDMQEDFDNIENLRKYIQMRAGHYDAVVTPKGETLYWPRSIQWEKLQEPEFIELFNDVIQAFIDLYGARITEEQLDHIARF